MATVECAEMLGLFGMAICTDYEDEAAMLLAVNLRYPTGLHGEGNDWKIIEAPQGDPTQRVVDCAERFGYRHYLVACGGFGEVNDGR